MAVRENEFDVDKDDLSDISLLLSVCCGIVVLGKANQTIQLVHYTAQDYFILKQEHWFPSVQSYLAQQCINYLSLEKFKDGLPVCGDRGTLWLPFNPDTSQKIEAGFYGDRRLEYTPGWYALYHYAAVYWGHHVRRATTSASDVDQAALTLLHSEKKINAALRIKIWGYDPDTFPHFDSIDDLSINGLHLAAFFGLDRLISLLVATFEVNSKDSNGRNALSWASEAGWHAVVKQLLLADADFDAVDDRGYTSLHLASWSKHVAVIQLLIDAGVNMNAVDSSGDTSLRYAIQFNNVEIVRLFINAGVDTDAVNSHGWTYLHSAGSFDCVKIMRLLIDAGVNIDAVDSKGNTVLHYATKSNHIEVIQLLIDGSVDIDAVDSYGVQLYTMLLCQIITESPT